MESRLLEILLKQKLPNPTLGKDKVRIQKCVSCGQEKDLDWGYYAGTNERNKTICCDCQKEQGRKLIEDYKKSGCDTAKMPPRERRADEQKEN